MSTTPWQPGPAVIRLHRENAHYLAGERLAGEFLVPSDQVSHCTACELSVLWHTAGQGEEDAAIHYFDRMRVTPEFVEPHPFSCVLPATPASYDGQIVKICWTVRVRLFFGGGKDTVSEHPFRLGEVSAAEVWKVAEIVTT